VDRPDGTALARFVAFDPGFRGGVRAAVAELDGNLTTVEVVVGAGPGAGPHVRAFRIDPTAPSVITPIASFFAFDPSFRGGVRVAAGNLGGSDNRDEMVVAADAGGGPHVRVFELARTGIATPIASPLGDFFAFEPEFAGGVRVAAGELDGNVSNGDELVVAAGRGGGPRVKVYRTDGAILTDYFAYRGTFAGGVNVAIPEAFGFGRPAFDARSDDPSQRGTTLNSLATGRLTIPAPVGNTVTNLIGIGSGAVAGTSVAPTTTDPDTLRLFGDPGPVLALPPLVGPPYVGRFSGLTIATPIGVFG
jgi:hypothetical protein